MTDIEINVEQEQNIDVEIENTNPIVTSDHAQLTHLDYANSGHIGFASSVQLQAEQTARESADDTLQDNIDAEATARANAVSGEQTARQNADSTLQDNIDDEEEARTSADNELDDKIDAEEERATAKENEIAGNLSNEVTTRQNADTTLQTNITNEATARQNADTNEANARANADNLLDGRLDVIEADYLKSSDKTALQSQITANANDIDAIESKIPSGASSVNQLADKSFVNSSIATNTAYFLGTLDVVSDLGLQYKATTSAIVTKLNDYEFTSDPTNNDYVFVVNKDANNNVVYQRFKYNASETTFLYEYALNNSSFTASQWSAINSGATDILIGKISTNESAIATETTNRANADDELQDNIDAEETRAKAEEQALDGRLDTIESDYLKASDKTALQNLITAEETRAEEVESGLDTRLDTIEADYLKESDKTALQSQITLNTNARHTHDNKSLLDTYDQTNANITDAVSKKHSHDNKSILDTITQTKLDKIDTNESNIASLDSRVDAIENNATTDISITNTTDIETYPNDLAIKSNQCLVSKVKGSSKVVNQGVKNGNFASASGWLTANCGLSVSNNEATITTWSSTASKFYRNIPTIANHKYLYVFTAKSITSGEKHIYSYYNSNEEIGYKNFYLTTSYQDCYNIFECSSTSDTYFNIRFTGSDISIVFKNIQLFDLTIMYGAGNEPTTYAQFLERYGNGYYSYGSYILSAKNYIEASGGNIWNEKWEVGVYNLDTGQKHENSSYIRNSDYIFVKPNETYYINNNVVLFYYDINKNYILYTSVYNSSFTIPSNCYYINFYLSTPTTTYNHDIAIKLNDNPDKTYEPNKHNKVIADKGIKRIGKVDLGSLSWGITSEGNNCFYTTLSTSQNILCGKYNTVSYSSIGTTDKAICYTGGNAIVIHDSAYTDTTQFKNSLNGIYLYYELATPIETELNEYNAINNIADESYECGTLSVYKYGLINNIGLIATKKYAVSISDQFSHNVETDRKQEAEIQKLLDIIQDLTERVEALEE